MSKLIREYRIDSIESLDSFALQWWIDFPSPAVFAVEGSMGAGKTTTINAICKAMGIEESSSPTFSLVNEYETKEKVKVFHFDLYRLESLREALDIGIEEYLEAEAYSFIEWPEIIQAILPHPHYRMTIEDKEEYRVIRISLIEN
ncbi:MAG: tRNA (adenosine(37)-N6)-threonylcarbamoyltransferase complex ATPase subunit type 1 TsaE [Flavobacteriales bacterium]|jgi:tRNA threonylcarbamoyladenosine biosynthesis protein TsaE